MKDITSILNDLGKLKPQMSEKQIGLLDQLSEEAKRLNKGSIRNMNKGWADIEWHLRRLHRQLRSE